MAAVPSEEEFDEDDDELEDGAEASRPCAVASQVNGGFLFISTLPAQNELTCGKF